MFVPKHFRVDDNAEIIAFIKAHSFATLITFDGSKPVASHIPVMLREKNGEHFIAGHLAYGNEQWKTFSRDETVLIIFQGPHAYVSASWYGHENVSTWNYQAVHVYGKLRKATEEETTEDVMLLQNHYEYNREDAATWETLSDETKKQVRGIVGFRMTLEQIEASYKMSQNRNELDYKAVIEHLKKEADTASHKVAKTMETLGQTNKK